MLSNAQIALLGLVAWLVIVTILLAALHKATKNQTPKKKGE